MTLFNKILLIDDENLCNLITTKVLLKANIANSVESFCDAKSALLRIKSDQCNTDQNLPNLILLDINMPGMNGWEFLEKFEQLPLEVIKNYQVMILSSSIDPRDVQRSETFASVKKFISKPFSVEAISS